eukprot:5723392-Prorocentrum_lima.AAC.1
MVVRVTTWQASKRESRATLKDGMVQRSASHYIVKADVTAATNKSVKRERRRRKGGHWNQ